MITLPDAEPETIADWIELYLVIESDAISKSELGNIIEQVSGEEATDALLSSVWSEMESRMQRYQAPPYDVTDRRIVRTQDMSSAYQYIMCLILSLFGFPDAQYANAKLFERLSALAVRQYLDGDVFIFGWPALDGTDAAIAGRIRQAAVHLNERLVETPAAQYKDRGVDIIAWKPFSENRSCQCVILAQCAAGKNWRSKTKDLPLRSWEQYIHWANNPITAFVVPCIISDEIWHDISKEAGILFDRIRLMNLLTGGVGDAILNDELHQWIERQLALITV